MLSPSAGGAFGAGGAIPIITAWDFVDSFDSFTLGKWLARNGSWAIGSGVAADSSDGTGTSPATHILWNQTGSTFSGGIELEMVLGTPNKQPCLIWHADTALSMTGYSVCIATAPKVLRLKKVVAGSASTVDTYNVPTVSAGDKISVIHYATGAIVVKYNGVAVITANDTDYTSGKIGLGNETATLGVEVDSIRARSL